MMEIIAVTYFLFKLCTHVLDTGPMFVPTEAAGYWNYFGKVFDGNFFGCFYTICLKAIVDIW